VSTNGRNGTGQHAIGSAADSTRAVADPPPKRSAWQRLRRRIEAWHVGLALLGAAFLAGITVAAVVNKHAAAEEVKSAIAPLVSHESRITANATKIYDLERRVDGIDGPNGTIVEIRRMIWDVAVKVGVPPSQLPPRTP
jgi:hypothetical protein